jgi:DNA repair exonuclease SbcCD nuclease subunit
MKIAFVADVHVGLHQRFGGAPKAGINRRCQMVLSTLRQAVNVALKENCAKFVVCGDLLDYVKIEPQILAALQNIFRKAKRAGMEVTLLKGNHENVSDAPGDHALGPLRPVASVLEKPTRVGINIDDHPAELLLIPHQSGPATQWLPKAVAGVVGQGTELGGGTSGLSSLPHRLPRVLAIHLGVSDGSTAPWLTGANDSVDVEVLSEICEKHGITYVFAGNWHDRREWHKAAFIQQIGALCPTGWDNPGLDLYGGVAIWDSKPSTFPHMHVIPGPRFVKAYLNEEYQNTTAYRDGMLAIKAAEVSARQGNQIFLQVTTDHGSMTSAKEELAKLDWLEESEVLADPEEAMSAARTAAATASNASNLDEALAGWVENMQIPEVVERPEVLELCRGYLK